MFQLVSLEHSKVKDFETLTFQHLLPRLKQIDNDPNLIAFGAESIYGAMGLIIAHVDQKLKRAEILSIYVRSEHRQKGIGTALLAEIESCLHEAGCDTVKLSYYSGKKVTSVLEAFLKKKEWTEPVVQTFIYKTDIKAIANAPWTRALQFPKNMETFMWSNLSEWEKDQLRNSTSIEYPSYLSPFKNEEVIDPFISIGLRTDTEIIGWSMVHHVSEDTRLYDSLFVESRYQHQGSAINLLAASIQLQVAANIPFGMFAVNTTNKVMKRLVDRWFEPYTISVTKMYVTFKSIS